MSFSWALILWMPSGQLFVRWVECDSSMLGVPQTFCFDCLYLFTSAIMSCVLGVATAFCLLILAAFSFKACLCSFCHMARTRPNLTVVFFLAPCLAPSISVAMLQSTSLNSSQLDCPGGSVGIFPETNSEKAACSSGLLHRSSV